MPASGRWSQRAALHLSPVPSTGSRWRRAQRIRQAALARLWHRRGPSRHRYRRSREDDAAAVVLAAGLSGQTTVGSRFSSGPLLAMRGATIGSRPGAV